MRRWPSMSVALLVVVCATLHPAAAHAMLYGIWTRDEGANYHWNFLYDEQKHELQKSSYFYMSDSGNVDAMAYCPDVGLYYFRHRASTNYSPELWKVTVTPPAPGSSQYGWAEQQIGQPILGEHYFHGAAFDGQNRLWVADRKEWNQPVTLCQVNPSTGEVVQGTQVGLDYPAYDLAFRADGTAYVSWGNALRTVNMSTGQTTLLGVDEVRGNYDNSPVYGNGLAFSEAAEQDDLFLYDTYAWDELYKYPDVDGFPANRQHLGTVEWDSFYGGGAGDLAGWAGGAPPAVPEPASCALLALAVGGVGAMLRRRRRS